MPTVKLSSVAGALAQFFDDNGAILASGKLYTYGAGGTNPQSAYTTSVGNVSHTNPIIIGPTGRIPSGGEIWLDTSLGYKFVLYTSLDVPVGTWDNIVGVIDTTGAVTFNDSVQINDDLAVAGDTTLTGNLAVTGTITGKAPLTPITLFWNTSYGYVVGSYYSQVDLSALPIGAKVLVSAMYTGTAASSAGEASIAIETASDVAFVTNVVEKAYAWGAPGAITRTSPTIPGIIVTTSSTIKYVRANLSIVSQTNTTPAHVVPAITVTQILQ